MYTALLQKTIGSIAQYSSNIVNYHNTVVHLLIFQQSWLKPIEDENKVLIDCLLYSSVKEKFNFRPQNITDLAGLLSNKTLDPTKFTATARAIHSILSVNEQYTGN